LKKKRRLFLLSSLFSLFFKKKKRKKRGLFFSLTSFTSKRKKFRSKIFSREEKREKRILGPLIKRDLKQKKARK